MLVFLDLLFADSHRIFFGLIKHFIKSRKHKHYNNFPSQLFKRVILWTIKLASLKVWETNQWVKEDKISLILTIIFCITQMMVYDRLCIDFLTGKCAVGSWRVSNILSELILSFSSFPFWSFIWIPRSANCAAHILARWSLLNRY